MKIYYAGGYLKVYDDFEEDLLAEEHCGAYYFKNRDDALACFEETIRERLRELFQINRVDAAKLYGLNFENVCERVMSVNSIGICGHHNIKHWEMKSYDEEYGCTCILAYADLAEIEVK